MSSPGSPTSTATASSGQTTSSTTPDPAKLAVSKAIATARKTHKEVPIPEATTAYATMVANPDGTVSANSHIAPQRAKVNGAWAPIDTTLATGADGKLHTKATVTAITLSGGGTTPLAVTDDGAGHVLTLTWPKPLPKPAISGSTATYPAVLPGVDLQVTASATGISHLLVVHDAAAAANPELATITVGETGTGLAISATPDGGVQAQAADGKKILAGQEPHMWDSADATTTPAPKTAKTAPTDAGGDGVTKPAGAKAPHIAAMPAQVAGGTITLKPDQNVLRGAQTVYPVFIDPAWVENAQNWLELSSGNNPVWDGQAPYPWAGYDNRVVRVGTSGGSTFRSLLEFNADILTPNNYTNFLIVSDAWLYLTFQGSCVTTDVWATNSFDSSVTWGNQDNPRAIWSSAAGAHVIGTNNCSATPWNPFPIPDLDQVQKVFAKNGTGHTYSVGLRAHTESSSGGYGAIQVQGNGGIPYDANITVKFVAEPWFEGSSIDGVVAPVGNHGTNTKICGTDSNSAGYLPMTAGRVGFTANVADWDAATLDYWVALNDYSSSGGTGQGGNGTVTTTPYSTSQLPGHPNTGGATTPIGGSFPSISQRNTSVGTSNVNAIYDGDLYDMWIQAWDTNTVVDNAFSAARNVEGNNLEYPHTECWFHAALSAPDQPDFPDVPGTTFPKGGSHITTDYPVVGDGGNLVVHSKAQSTPIVRFDWALNTSSTSAGANNCNGVVNASCGSVPVAASKDTNATITIGGGPGTHTLGTGEHWGNNYIYVTAVDAAGNVSAAGRFDFFLGQAFQPVSFGNVTGDGTPNLMKADTAGNLDIYPANRDMDPAAANAVQVAPAAAAPNGTSWATAKYTHRGAERVQPTDDMFAWDKLNGTGRMYYYFNSQIASASTQPGYIPPPVLNQYTQQQKALVTRPTCTPSALNGYCVGYNPTSWNDVLQVLAVGPVLGGCDIKHPTIACKTNLITIEGDGRGPSRMWMFSPAGVGQLRNPVLLSTSNSAWDWSTVKFLMAPGNAANHPAPAGAPAAGGLPDLWAVDAAGTLWQFTNRSDVSVAGAGLGDFTARTQLGTTGQFHNYDWVNTVGDLDGDGKADLWVINGGRMDVLFGPIGTNITDQNTDPMHGGGTKPTQGQSTATTPNWNNGATTFQSSTIGAGLAGQIVLPAIVAGPSGQKCLDDLNGSLANSTTVIDLYDCNGTTPQQWSFAADGSIRYLGSAQGAPKCLDGGGSFVQGQHVTLFDCQPGNRNQIWRTIPSPASPGAYWIYNPAGGMCLDDSGGSINNQNPFQLWPCIDSVAQRFTLPSGPNTQQQVEAESLWASQSGASPTPQGNCCGISLSNGLQSYFPASTANSYITYRWYVPQDGTYTVAPALTKTNDRGQYTLSIDGGAPLPATFDGYQANGVSLAPFVFGKATLSAGEHTFTFTATGTNPASVGNRYVLGLDTITLQPTTSLLPNVSLAGSASGLVGLPVTLDASGTTPGAATITGYTFDFGDGTVVGPQTSATATHTYSAAGTYTATVTANDGSPTPATTAEAMTVTAGPSSMWKLNDGSGTTAADTGSSAAFPATTSGGASLVPGGYGLFDGSTGYAATSAPAIDTTKSFTVAAWVKLTNTNGYQTVLTQQGSKVGGFHLEFENNGSNGNIWAFARATSDNPGPAFVRANSTGGVQVGVWTHLIASWDASTGLMSLYVNGQQVATAIDNTPIASNGPFVIGCGFYNSTGNNYTSGGIADVRAYQQPFGADLASWLYQNTGFARNSSLVYTLGTPTTLVSGDGVTNPACSTDPAHPAVSTSLTPSLKANVSGTNVHADFEIQDVTAPGSTPPLLYTSSGAAGTVASTSVPTATPSLANGHTYRWNARADDGNGSISKNHTPCYLQILSGTQTPVPATGEADVLFDNTVYTASNPQSWSGPLTTLKWQTDGNLVLYKKNGQPIWSSNSAGYTGAVLAFQNNGDMVVYNTMPLNTDSGTLAGAVLWSSGTAGKGTVHMVVQKDGNVVIYSGSGALFGMGGDVWNLQNVAVGRCLDSNTQGQLYSNPCASLSNGYQRWLITTNSNGSLTFQDVATGLCLDGDGTSVYTHPCTAGNGYQQWLPTWGGSGWILKHVASGKVLDMQTDGTPYFNAQNGGNYQQWD
ncbi:ricin-type beta-trefoil lectin domain protein [Catenulispora subtropica]|uniref:Ricin B lectin n=1 Tax=Catenulispora subtropica TaxID=450798 RepID=A0ABN2SA75_9ACTN